MESIGGFSIDEVNRAFRVLEDDREETLAESRAALEREGLVEHNGLLRPRVASSSGSLTSTRQARRGNATAGSLDLDLS